MNVAAKILLKAAMPPKLEDGMKTERLQVLASEAWVQRIDEWRRKQPSIPSRSSAIRMLADIALQAAEAAKPS